MIDEFHPRLDSSDLDDVQRSRFKLADAQLIIARMYRSVSWAKLRDQLGTVNGLSFTPRAERPGYVDYDESFVELACLNYAENGPNPHDRIRRAHEMLAADPTGATGSLEALATVGDHREVTAWLERSPNAVNRPCGPSGWPPLLYAVYSRIETGNEAWSAIETVNVLLAAGADPNAGFLWRGLVPPFTALTGAIGSMGNGHPQGPERFEIARLLLEAGADPNDGQALHNNGIGGKNHDDPRHLELLFEFGLGVQQNGPWYQRLGDNLGDPGESLYHELEAAVKRGRPNHLRLLIGRGLELDRPVGRSQNTPVRLAAENGNHEILDMLAAAGIDTTLTPDEEFLDAIRTTDQRRLIEILDGTPEFRKTVLQSHEGAIKAVTAQGREILEVLLTLGLDINARTGGNGTTALHEAAQSNDVPRARMLIEHGADPNLTDHYFRSTPWGWANHFHHTDVAGFLHPRTDHAAVPTDITIQFPGGPDINASSVDDLDRALDDIHERVDQPVIVHLTASGATLSLGLGNPDVSVVLYRDSEGRPWNASAHTELVGVGGELSFRAPGGEFDFFTESAVSVLTARHLARKFAESPDQRPLGANWKVEGGNDD